MHIYTTELPTLLRTEATRGARTTNGVETNAVALIAAAGRNESEWVIWGVYTIRFANRIVLLMYFFTAKS